MATFYRFLRKITSPLNKILDAKFLQTFKTSNYQLNFCQILLHWRQSWRHRHEGDALKWVRLNNWCNWLSEFYCNFMKYHLRT